MMVDMHLLVSAKSFRAADKKTLSEWRDYLRSLELDDDIINRGQCEDIVVEALTDRAPRNVLTLAAELLLLRFAPDEWRAMDVKEQKSAYRQAVYDILPERDEIASLLTDAWFQD